MPAKLKDRSNFKVIEVHSIGFIEYRVTESKFRHLLTKNGK